MPLKDYFKHYIFNLNFYFWIGWAIIISTKNPWVVPPVVFKIKKEAVVRIKSEPVELSIKINSHNYKILYYLSFLRNQGNLLFDGTKVKFLPCGVELLPDQMVEEEVVIIYFACILNLSLERHEDYYLLRLKDGMKFKVKKISQISNLAETFIKNQYQRFGQDLKGKVVLDIGTSIGDTPIYFSRAGAKMVYAYEPDPYSFNLAMDNLKLNSISNVKLFEVGVGASKGKIATKSFSSSEKVIINVLPFSEVIKQVGEVDFLKMDCEGCEFPALLSLSNKELSNIKELVIEYHKNPSQIVEKLKNAGFLVNVEEPWMYDQGYPVGFLHARKQN
ncbi:MAG: FkbM family methyltransferase [Candidatus Freyarchaeum deiterrae]